MKNFKKIDNEFYSVKYGSKKSVHDSNEIWKKIKDNKELLNWAIKPTKDKFNERDLVNGLAICDSILINYDDVDKEIYNKLVDLIYSNKQIARIVQDGYSNGGYSYLLMTLWNPNLKLSEAKKAFAVDEAMNKIGTTRYKNTMNEYSKQLDYKGITDDETMYTEFGGVINPVGAETGNMYLAELFNSMSNTQAHGSGDFDIRYWILKNPNWSLEEKQKLIMNFWYDNEVYDETLDQWEWGVVNDLANHEAETFWFDKKNIEDEEDENEDLKNALDDELSDTMLFNFDKCKMYDYSYEELLKLYGDKNTTDRIWEEIQFCKKMHQLRPKQWEISYVEEKAPVKTIQK